MARCHRVTVKLSPAMTVALDVLAHRNGLAPSTQAMVLLRQALDRTMGSAEVRSILADRAYDLSGQQKADDMAVEHLVEGSYAIAKARARYEGGDGGTQEAVEGAGDAVATPTA
jgi:hypothetical protein